MKLSGLVLAAAGLLLAAEAAQLQTYSIDLQHISLSGLSAGAFMAVQYHTIHSSKIRGKCSALRDWTQSFTTHPILIAGLGVIAGGPFFCAQANVDLALTSCMNPDAICEPDAALA